MSDVLPGAWLGSPAHGRWLEAEGDRLLDFGRASRDPAGGFAWLDAAGRPDPERPVELWITCRMTHVFGLGALMGRPGCGPLADHGVAALGDRFRDAVHGGWYGAIGADGPVSGDKAAYGHAFVLLAAATASCAARPGADELLGQALEVVLDWFWDDEHGMVVEQWDESFSSLDPYRGLNANMHTVEAFLAAADVTGDRSLLDRALRITTRVLHELGPAHHWRLPEHFDDAWNPQPDYNLDTPAHPFRPYGATIGHGLEWTRLALHLRAALGADAPGWLLDAARALFEASVADGWAVDGADGFVYTVDWSGRPVVRQRMHWVAAEATAAAAALWQATGDPSYDAWYRTWWDHVACVFLDRHRGSWHHELDPENRPDDATWSGKPDTYHAFQATLFPRLPLSPTLSVALRDGLLA
ncbi:AGE family epimerase/isomerase [Nocardioides sp. GXQ0305]|uniref:AGE family epimerase/isomerase n=1 Tax=Nocardioides sp. GXQ0305 TaxID=3423912 RepID=UPI003D7CE40D